MFQLFNMRYLGGESELERSRLIELESNYRPDLDRRRVEI